MSFYGYNPSSYSKSYGAAAIAGIGEIAANAVTSVTSAMKDKRKQEAAAKLAQNNKLNNKELVDTMKNVFDQMPDDLFTEAGKTKQEVTAKLASIDLNQKNVDVIKSLEEIGGPIEEVAKVRMKNVTDQTIGQGINEVATGRRVGTTGPDSPIPIPENSTYYGSDVTEITMPAKNPQELQAGARRYYPGATTEQTIKHPAYRAAEDKMASEVLSKEGMSRPEARTELAKQGFSTGAYEGLKDLPTVEQQEKEKRRLADEEASRVAAQQYRDAPEGEKPLTTDILSETISKSGYAPQGVKDLVGGINEEQRAEERRKQREINEAIRKQLGLNADEDRAYAAEDRKIATATDDKRLADEALAKAQQNLFEAKDRMTDLQKYMNDDKYFPEEKAEFAEELEKLRNKEDALYKAVEKAHKAIRIEEDKIEDAKLAKKAIEDKKAATTVNAKRIVNEAKKKEEERKRREAAAKLKPLDDTSAALYQQYIKAGKSEEEAKALLRDQHGYNVN